METGFVPVLEEDLWPGVVEEDLWLGTRGQEDMDITNEETTEDEDDDDTISEEITDNKNEAIRTGDKWKRVVEKDSKQKLLLQKRLTFMEAKESLMETGKKISTKVERIEEKVKIEQDLLDMHTDIYKSSLIAQQRDKNKFKDETRYYLGYDMKLSRPDTVCPTSVWFPYWCLAL